jgi:hypothetical protein
MRIPAAVIIAALGAVSASAQDKPKDTNPNCAPIHSIITAPPKEGQLYLKTARGWDQMPRTESGILGTVFGPGSYPLQSYRDNSLHFIYIAAATAGAAKGRSFLAIRVTSPTNDPSDSDGIVNLRRHHIPVPRSPHIGAYQDYHNKGNDNSSILRLFHSWREPTERSDKPDEIRRSYAFPDGTTPAIRRVLSLGYFTSVDRLTCVPFRLGPNLAAWSADEVGSDPIYLPSPFKISITEAKTANGHSGATFYVRLSSP